MSSTMADDEEASRNMMRLTNKLMVAVRSLQWSYAIFWSSSQIQNGVLEWRQGYYNGDLKKRKKNNSYEVDSKYGLQRSKQLRNLYLSMLEGDTTTHGHGHDDDDDSTTSNVKLSPDDLSDEEWYYLVCMSYIFSPTQCLPGKALASGEIIWLCNAQHAETKLFTRSLLARSASIQTVVCFPYLDGVIELGVTELIAEDGNMIQHIKDCLSKTSNLDCSKMKISDRNSKLEELTKDGNHQFSPQLDEDLQYKKTLSNLLRAKGKDYCYDMNDSRSSDSRSSFMRWKSSSVPSKMNHSQNKNNVLLKILHDVPLMHSSDVKRVLQTDTTGLNYHVSVERDDDHTENEKFSVLKSMVPTVNEVDKESILNNTIKYLKKLEARVEELESRVMDKTPTMKENVLSELIEETSETDQVVMVRDEVRVKLKGSEVLIEVRCLYRDYIVADIMEAMSNLSMDTFSIRSHTHDGLLILNLKTKFRGTAATPVGMIKRELKRITCEV